ncbi:hypothetical protein BJY52DRAFT_1317483 [Lactarius psammicola]|nr:hypothetical protein BJY52DRAFT_1317483 [Lactarius psammicola]
MSFRLQPSAVNKAREIAERALRTINLRELNVWIALMNLKLSTVPKSLESVFKDAARHCVPRIVRP